MAQFTTELGTIVSHYAGLDHTATYSELSSAINTALPHIFDFSYPIYDETHRRELEFKIVLTYYRNEIGFETLGEFKRALWSKLNNIMPYYNEMYRIDALEFDPFINVDYEVTGNDSRGTIDHATGGTISSKKNTGTQQTSESNTGTQTTNTTNTGTQTTDTDYTGTQNTTTDYTGTQNTTTDYTGTQNIDTDYTGTQNTDTDYTGTCAHHETNTGTQTIDTTQSGSIADVKTYANTDTETKNLTTTTKHSDTPQGGLSGLTSDTYLSDATISLDTGTDATAHTGTVSDQQTFNNKKDAVSRSDNLNHSDTRTDNLNTDSTRTDNLNTDSTRTDDLNTDSTRTDDLNTDSTRTDNLNTNSTRTDNLTEASTRTDNLAHTGTRTDNLTEAYSNNFTNDASSNTSGNSYKHVVGKMGGLDYVELTERMEKAIDNIDLMIINECRDLFMLLW